MRTARRLALALFLGSLAVEMPVAVAATFTVDSPMDQVDAVPGDGACQTLGGTCTLRAAVQEADALAGADAIDVPAGTYVLTIPASPPYDASSGDLNVTEELTVTGAGAAGTILDGNGTSRIFYATAPLTVSAVTLQNGGDPFGNGGAVGALAPLVISDCVVKDSETSSAGGGIYAIDLTLVRSTVSGNSSAYGGGGIAAVSGSVRDSTITGNINQMETPARGDQILLNGGGTFTVANSTVDGELANLGYCIPPPNFMCSPGDTVTLSNVTVGTVMQQSFGGDAGTVTVRNSIAGQCSGQIFSGGYNLFQQADCSIFGDTTGNLVGIDPLLGPLAYNGGTTRTRKPQAGSPVLEAGNPAAPGSGGSACESTDQRGVVRPIGSRCDMGAVEGDCGDTIVGPGEECDDGNLVNGDGCSDACIVE